ncbi:hypothetical protein NDU88_006166 [Pleurodeles waltl]|uniref:Uncharacterized protein n=1 Tax=Pleurodeles waltl TaxID=8319 RepID=A0AAV7TW13_PLEWA|nr:hypothetical protein NDU88_006166 [Pleurodeles waltl]
MPVTGQHCRICHTPGAPALRRFPIRKSSGREAIGLDFRVTAGRNRPFAPSPEEEDEKAGKEGARTGREKAAASEREKAVKDPRTERKGRQQMPRQRLLQWRTGRTPEPQQHRKAQRRTKRQFTRIPATLWEERGLSRCFLGVHLERRRQEINTKGRVAEQHNI